MKIQIYFLLLLKNDRSSRPGTLLKKRLWCRRFPVNLEKFLRTPSLTENLQWLLLTVK